MKLAPRELLRRMFDAAINAAQPAHCIPPHVPTMPRGRLLVIGAGKASAAMARAFEEHWPDELSGLVVTRYGYGVPCDHIEIVEAAHPVHDAAGLAAARRVLDMVRELSAVNRALLKSGASISEMNCVRRHLSAIKGGRLAAACHPAKVVTLLISDVPGDNPMDVASGPTVPDPTTCADALAIITRYAVDLPANVMEIL